MKKLIELFAIDNSCGIDDYGIKDLINLKKIHAIENTKITRHKN
jgi:hypothetical protein